MQQETERLTETPKGRVIIEKTELSVKIAKLENFLKSAEYKALKKRSRKLLKRQVKTMIKYKEILSERLLFWD